MKFILLFILSVTILAGDFNFTDGTAETLKKRRMEVGVFSPLRYGLKKDLEIKTYPLMNFIMPNLAIKKRYLTKNKIVLSSEHYFSYPTLIMKLISKRGIAGLLPETQKDKIPQQIYTEHSLILTYTYSDYLIITPKISLSLPLIYKNKNFTQLDMFLLYNRTAPFGGDLVYSLSFDIDGKIYKKLYYCLDFDLYDDLPFKLYSDAKEINTVYEHKFYLIWKQNENIAFLLGYKLVYGNYPYGRILNVLPLVDIIFSL